MLKQTLAVALLFLTAFQPDWTIGHPKGCKGCSGTGTRLTVEQIR